MEFSEWVQKNPYYMILKARAFGLSDESGLKVVLCPSAWPDIPHSFTVFFPRYIWGADPFMLRLDENFETHQFTISDDGFLLFAINRTLKDVEDPEKKKKDIAALAKKFYISFKDGVLRAKASRDEVGERLKQFHAFWKAFCETSSFYDPEGPFPVNDEKLKNADRLLAELMRAYSPSFWRTMVAPSGDLQYVFTKKSMKFEDGSPFELGIRESDGTLEIFDSHLWLSDTTMQTIAGIEDKALLFVVQCALANRCFFNHNRCEYLKGYSRILYTESIGIKDAIDMMANSLKEIDGVVYATITQELGPKGAEEAREKGKKKYGKNMPSLLDLLPPPIEDELLQELEELDAEGSEEDLKALLHKLEVPTDKKKIN